MLSEQLARIEGGGGGGLFFQAEDGIRIWCVTGVQTCALPFCSCCPTPGDLDDSWVAGLRVVRLKDLTSQAPPGLDLSVVIPVYDEQDSIGPLHAEESGRATRRERV